MGLVRTLAIRFEAIIIRERPSHAPRYQRKGTVTEAGGKWDTKPRHDTKPVHSRPTTIYDPLPLPKAEARRSCFSALSSDFPATQRHTFHVHYQYTHYTSKPSIVPFHRPFAYRYSHQSQWHDLKIESLLWPMSRTVSLLFQTHNNFPLTSV